MLSRDWSTAVCSSDLSTCLKRRLSGRKRVAWARPLNLKHVKDLGRAMGATVNDILLAAATGASRKYLVRRGDDSANEQRSDERRVGQQASSPGCRSR